VRAFPFGAADRDGPCAPALQATRPARD